MVSRSSEKNVAGWSSPVAREAHNLEVTGSNPVPAILMPGSFGARMPCRWQGTKKNVARRFRLAAVTAGLLRSPDALPLAGHEEKRRTRCNLNGGSGFCRFVRLRAGGCGRVLYCILHCK